MHQVVYENLQVVCENLQVVCEIYTTCFDQSDHSICNNYDLNTNILTC